MSDFRIDKITNRDGSSGTQIAGISTFSGTSGMQLPVGPTEYRGGRGRAVFQRGYGPSTYTGTDFVEIATTGNAIEFGTATRMTVQAASAGSSTRGIVTGGSGPTSPQDQADYFTFSSKGGYNDFGELTRGRRGTGACNDSTRAVFGGGAGNAPNPSPNTDIIDYFTFSTTGQASDFGDLTKFARQMAGCSSPTRGIFAGGYNPVNNIIDYITTQSRGNAKDFGDLTVARGSFSGGSNATRGLFASGFANPTNYNIIDYITIATTGNATDFGDTLQTGVHNTGTACSQTRALFAGGYNDSPTVTTNVISYSTIATTGDAVDFGDMTSIGSVGNDGAASDVNGGLG